MKWLVSKIFRPLSLAHTITRTRTGRADRWLLVAVVVLTLIGIIMVYDSSIAIALRDFGDPYRFVREQVRFLIVGYGALLFFSWFDYRRLYGIALPLLLVTLALLFAVFIPGFGVRALGAYRWLNFRFFILQPAELAKLSLVIYLSAWFSMKEKGRVGAFVLLLAMVVGLVVAEPDLGTAIVILITACFLYWFSGALLSHVLLLAPLFVAAVAVLAIASPYRFARIQTFLNRERDPLGASYQIRQVLLGLGSGGMFGVGFGKSRQKYEYLPEANTDSIFAVLGEETGFAGGIFVILLFLFTIWRAFRIGRRAHDSFGRLLAFGIASWIGIQTVINLGAMVALLPLTGVPLPLISYGGSSLVITLSAIGILLNVSKHL